MLGALYIFLRQMDEMRHRRKLLGFLVLLPVLLMVLVGVALGEEKVPGAPAPSDLAAVQDLRKDPVVRTVIQILRQESGGQSEGTGLRLLAAAVRSPIDPESKMLLYLVPSSQNTTVVLFDEGTNSYYYLVFENQSSSVLAAAGPKLAPVPSGFESMPQVEIEPLHPSETVLRVVKAAEGLLHFGLQLQLTPERRLLDVIFAEIVGVQIAWVGVLGAAVTAVEDRMAGARKRILMTPVSRSSFILGNAMANFSLIALQLGILFATALVIFGVKIAGSSLDLIPVIVAAGFSVIGIGLIISHFSKTPDEAFYLSTLVNLPMGLLGSRLLGPFSVTPISHLVSSIFPMTYANDALTGIMVDGASLLSVVPQLLVLALFAAVFYPVGTIILSRER